MTEDLIRPDGLSFRECLFAAAGSAEFVRQFDRLTGSNLSLRGSGLDLAIDKATGRLDADLGRFCAFVFDVVFLRVPMAQEKSP